MDAWEDEPSKPTHADIWRELRHIRTAIGHENAEGTGGEGILGRLARIEARVSAYDRWKERVTGFLMGASILVAVIWWLTKDKLGAVFGVSQ